jgi:hypothetical protein
MKRNLERELSREEVALFQFRGSEVEILPICDRRKWDSRRSLRL